MKKSLLLLSIGLLLFASSQAGAIGITDIGFKIGLATPNDNINDVYNANNLNMKLEDDTISGSWLKNAASLGYHIGVNVRVGLSDKFQLTGGLGLNKFPQTESPVVLPNANDTVLFVSESTYIIPFSLGGNFYLIKNVIGLYGLAELQYNYITSTVEVRRPEDPTSVPVTENPSYNRLGAAIGVGFDFDLQILMLNLEAKYNLSNINRETGDEKSKNYLNVTLGVYF